MKDTNTINKSTALLKSLGTTNFKESKVYTIWKCNQADQLKDLDVESEYSKK